MRLIIDTLIALMLAGILAAVLIGQRQRSGLAGEVQTAQRALARLHEQAMYHGALGDVPVSATGFPVVLSPQWFDEELPQNPLVSGRCGWLDIAPPGDMDDNPPDPVAEGAGQGSFWYNPNRGIFRARVRRLFTDGETLALYNRVNATALAGLPESVPVARRPEAWVLAAPADPTAELRVYQGPAAQSDLGRSPATNSTAPAPVPVSEVPKAWGGVARPAEPDRLRPTLRDLPAPR